jgi:hypothetical protein
MKYLLIKNEKVVNVIKADSEFVPNPNDYDLYLEIEDSVSVNPGDGYVNGQIIPTVFYYEE